MPWAMAPPMPLSMPPPPPVVAGGAAGAERAGAAAGRRVGGVVERLPNRLKPPDLPLLEEERMLLPPRELRERNINGLNSGSCDGRRRRGAIQARNDGDALDSWNSLQKPGATARRPRKARQ